ncbi:hypothetical protein BDV35DRAFT_138 [Aspergillus flavus]|uniref:Uncharacterized protein n=1 Tax=Aspergillus flavus TaxID=5059 RepID=A0A5N6HH81_ASPFL|nr:hypothetical protein BDV35DRAFT_138 [Aspergillus flavus]
MCRTRTYLEFVQLALHKRRSALKAHIWGLLSSKDSCSEQKRELGPIYLGGRWEPNAPMRNPGSSDIYWTARDAASLHIRPHPRLVPSSTVANYRLPQATLYPSHR